MRKVDNFPRLFLGVTFLLVSFGPVAFHSAALSAEEETPDDIIAVQLRDQGYKCDNPNDAKLDKDASKPDEKVWILECDEAVYRVKLIPDMAADVERLE